MTVTCLITIDNEDIVNEDIFADGDEEEEEESSR